jgi:hypothetical protein
MAKLNQILMGLALLLCAAPLAAQPCYIQLGDATGLPLPPAQLAELEAAACELRDAFPVEFQSDFAVYDFGFYLHQERYEGGVPGVFQAKVAEVEGLSSYYFLIGRAIKTQGFLDFYIELKLPENSEDSCYKGELYMKNQILKSLNLNFTPDLYVQKEQQAMLSLIRLKSCEICDNDIDDDGDGFIDCEDLDCMMSQLTDMGNRVNRNPTSCAVLTAEQEACLLEYQDRFEEIGIHDTETAIAFCNELHDLLGEENGEVSPINNGITIISIYAPEEHPAFVPGRLVADTEYRFPHNPPYQIAPDMVSRTDGDSSIISRKCRVVMRNAGTQELEGKMASLLDFATSGQYKAVASRFMQHFVSGAGGIYDDVGLSNLIKQTNELQNKVKRFGKIFENKLRGAEGDYNQINHFRLPQDLRYVFSKANGYLLKGPTILINDVSQVRYHLQSCVFDSQGNWHGVFYVEVIDHFGLDNDDPNHGIGPFSLLTYQDLHCGFAAWWSLQHQHAYKPFRTRMRFIVALQGGKVINP